MQFTTTLTALLAVATATMAAPTPLANAGEASDISARAATWTLEDFSRRCGGGSCTFSYTINDGTSTTDCYYKSAGKHASYSTTCGPYAITSAWDDQFGAENGFSTMSMVKGSQIIYPSYSDAEVKGGKVVKPDHSYTPVAV